MPLSNVIPFPFNTNRHNRTRKDSLTTQVKISQIVLYALDHIGTENCNIIIFNDVNDVSSSRPPNKHETSLLLAREAIQIDSENPFGKVCQNKIISTRSEPGLTGSPKSEQNKCTYRCLSYAITSMDGRIIGKFYVYDPLPRKYSESEVFTFTILGTIIENVLKDNSTFSPNYW